MSSLKRVQIGDFIDVLTDYHSNGSYKTLKDNVTLLPVKDYAIMIRTLNFERNDFSDDLIYVDKSAYEHLVKSKVYPNDILTNKIANPGSIYIMPDLHYPVTCGMNLFLIRFSPTVNQRYMYYCMKNSEEYIKSFAHGTTTKTITKEEVRSIDLLIHTDINEQNKIEHLLSSIDRKIEINQHINDNLQHQLKLLYDYWFTQFDFPDKNGKPYRASGGTLVWNEQLKREIPQYWSIGTVSDCVEKISTGLNPRDNFVLGNGSIRYITVKNLTTTGSLDFSGCDMIDEEARTIVHRRSDISVGDILFASIAPLGRCYLIQQEPTDWDINESVFSIRSKTDKITPEYLYLFFQSDSFIQKATNTSTGSIFKGIRINTLLDTKMIIPELQVCRSFTSAIKPLLAEINNNSAETARLTALRDWLLPMLMNGQATISD
jgi:type I restriction enzyme S subunit